MKIYYIIYVDSIKKMIIFNSVGVNSPMECRDRYGFANKFRHTWEYKVELKRLML